MNIPKEDIKDCITFIHNTLVIIHDVLYPSFKGHDIDESIQILQKIISSHKYPIIDGYGQMGGDDKFIDIDFSTNGGKYSFYYWLGYKADTNSISIINPNVYFSSNLERFFDVSGLKDCYSSDEMQPLDTNVLNFEMFLYFYLLIPSTITFETLHRLNNLAFISQNRRPYYAIPFCNFTFNDYEEQIEGTLQRSQVIMDAIANI